MKPLHHFVFLAPLGSVSVGHGPGAGGNDGTAKDRSTSAPDSNLTEIDATQENQARPGSDQRAERQPGEGKAFSTGGDRNARDGK